LLLVGEPDDPDDVRVGREQLDDASERGITHDEDRSRSHLWDVPRGVHDKERTVVRRIQLRGRFSVEERR